MRFKITSLTLLMLLSLSISPVLSQQTGALSQSAKALAAQEDVTIQRALEHYRAGKLNEAAGLLRGFVISQPDSDLINQAYYYLARIHNDLNDPTTAIDYLGKMDEGARPMWRG